MGEVLTARYLGHTEHFVVLLFGGRTNRFGGNEFLLIFALLLDEMARTSALDFLSGQRR